MECKEQSKPQHIPETVASWTKSLEPIVFFLSTINTFQCYDNHKSSERVLNDNELMIEHKYFCSLSKSDT